MHFSILSTSAHCHLNGAADKPNTAGNNKNGGVRCIKTAYYAVE